ncbi:hypothetical protein B0H14DRAFT_3767499 [Mycena olivaceomarginata]|nr:hypothetical protein B0H14DRAFT_3767499 [Mycena olivaceomarginata]
MTARPPPPAEPRPLFPPSSPPPPPSSSPPPCNSEDDPRDSDDIPPADDELLATSPSHDDDYPRPCATRAFLDKMHKQATHPGVLRQAPNIGEAKAALDCVQRFLRRELCGTDLWGHRGVGYKDPDISAFTRNRLTGIQAELNFYVTPGTQSGTHGRWGASAQMAALGLGRGKQVEYVFVSTSCLEDGNYAAIWTGFESSYQGNEFVACWDEILQLGEKHIVASKDRPR